MQIPLVYVVDIIETGDSQEARGTTFDKNRWRRSLPHLIKAITVNQLFGRYDYEIRLGGSTDGEVPQVSLLYGDNGTGKTTILNLVFHLLSSDLARGHKTHIASVPFRQFVVTFADNTTVSASRHLDHLTGSFDLSLSPHGGPLETVRIDVDPEPGAVPPSLDLSELASLLQRISGFVPAVFSLGDDRTLESDTLPVHHSSPRRRRIPHRPEQGVQINVDPASNEPRETALNESLRRTQQQLYVELAHASTRGEADARQIYAEVLGSIASTSNSSDSEPERISDLERDLIDLEKTSKKFETFELDKAIDAAPLLESLFKADDITMPIVTQVMRSYLNGQKARLNALDVLYKKMHAFVHITNDYLTDKWLALDMTKGVRIRIDDGELDLSMLSSGEQHLLLLFLNVFTSSDQSRLFIIDEPELSLNVKWQRQLVDSLVALTHGTQCQFLLATHSIELLSKHKNHVVKLKQ